MTMTATKNPISFEEAAKEKHSIDATKNEFSSIVKNLTWRLVDPPQSAKIVDAKWVFRTKLNVGGNIEKHKAKPISKGCSWRHGVDYIEMYAPSMSIIETVRIDVVLAAQRNWKVFSIRCAPSFFERIGSEGNNQSGVFWQKAENSRLDDQGTTRRGIYQVQSPVRSSQARLINQLYYSHS